MRTCPSLMATSLRTAGPARVLARRPPPDSLWEVARAPPQAEVPSSSGTRARKRPPLLSPSLPRSSQTAAPPRKKAVPPREPTWRSPPTPPPASASLRHATACFATPPFLLCHLTSTFFRHISVFSPVTDGGIPAGGGSLQRADLIPAADLAPGECFSVARYRLLRHTAVFFVSSGIIVFFLPHTRVSAVTDDTPRRRKRRRHHVGPAQAARRHQRTHFSVVPPPAADGATIPTASAAATLAASSPPDVTVGIAVGATAAAPEITGHSPGPKKKFRSSVDEESISRAEPMKGTS